MPQKQAEELLSCSELKEPARFFFFKYLAMDAVQGDYLAPYFWFKQL